jgi:hypothetical protein
MIAEERAHDIAFVAPRTAAQIRCHGYGRAGPEWQRGGMSPGGAFESPGSRNRQSVQSETRHAAALNERQKCGFTKAPLPVVRQTPLRVTRFKRCCKIRGGGAAKRDKAQSEDRIAKSLSIGDKSNIHSPG